MLNRMLNQHPLLFLPSEQYFLGNSIIKFKLYNFLIWRDLMKIIAGELIPSTQSHTWNLDANHLFNELFCLSDKALDLVIDRIYRGYGNTIKEGFSVWGDSTPLNTRYLPEIYGTFPQAKYIFLIRDGRDVMASYKEGGTKYLGRLADPAEAAGHWKHAITKYDWLKKRTPVLEVKYEVLVRSPEEILGQVCQFLGIDYYGKMLHFYQEKQDIGMYEEPQHKNLSKPVFIDSVGRWEQVLTTRDKMIIAGMEKDLQRFGYR